MSYRVEVIILCDHVGCRARYVRQEINRGGLGKTHAGRMADSQGWWIKGSGSYAYDPETAYCPEHRLEHGHG